MNTSVWYWDEQAGEHRGAAGIYNSSQDFTLHEKYIRQAGLHLTLGGNPLPRLHQACLCQSVTCFTPGCVGATLWRTLRMQDPRKTAAVHITYGSVLHPVEPGLVGQNERVPINAFRATHDAQTFTLLSCKALKRVGVAL